MRTAPARAQISPTDRLGLTLSLAILVHGIIILGISFAAEEQPTPRYNSMEIVLVQQRDKEPPEEAKLLAQASLDGGGDVSEDLTPASPLPPPFPDETPAVSAPPPAENQPATAEQESPDQTAATAQAAPEQALEQLAVESDTAENSPTEQTKPATEKGTAESAQSKAKRPRPSAAALLTSIRKSAALSAEIKQKLEARAKRPKRNFISASTQEYRYAAYMEAWRAKVERVGNLNYPEAARKRKLSGSLILDVALNPDGTIHAIIVSRSSGHKILDDAAVRIVKLAAPFAPFPANIKKDTDILHIIRTWQFLDKGGFRQARR